MRHVACHQLARPVSLRLAATCLVVLALTGALSALLPAASLSSAEAGSLAKDVALVKTLKKQRLSQVSFKEASLKDVVKWLRVATGKNIIIKRAALTKAGVEWKELSYSVTLKNVSVWTFMESILTKPYGMGLKVKGNIVFLTSKADTYGKPVTKMYSISHITYTKTDFFAPEINLNPSGFQEEEYEPEKIVEDDPLTEGDAVAELLKEILLPKGWENNDSWSIRATTRYLVIRAPRAVHALVPRVLGKIAALK